MRAVDTNILIRMLTRDDPAQADRATEALAAGDCFIPITVLLETAWALASQYRFTKPQVVAALRDIAGLPGITVEDAPAVAQALDWTTQRLDLADALHLARSRDCDALLTFDERFVTRAAGLGDVAVGAPLGFKNETPGGQGLSVEPSFLTSDSREAEPNRKVYTKADSPYFEK